MSRKPTVMVAISPAARDRLRILSRARLRTMGEEVEALVDEKIELLVTKGLLTRAEADGKKKGGRRGSN